MVVDAVARLRNTLEELRSVFLGAASRHDSVESRWVIAEAHYDSFLQGPDDNWSKPNPIAIRSYTLRDPGPRLVSTEQRQEILSERPEAMFGGFEGSSQIFYMAPGINSSFEYRGDHRARDVFNRLSSDAAFCLLQLLPQQQLSLKLPELVPFEAIGHVGSRSGSTNLPMKLTERWLGFLHILGWQNLDLCPLRAERAIWYESTTILGDPTELQRVLATSPPMFGILKEKFSFPPRYFASTLATDLNLASVYAIDTLLSGSINLPVIDVDGFSDELKSIKAGRDDATTFHALVRSLLAIIFEPDLHSPACEEKLHDGRGRVDIVFENAAEKGYFADLPFRHNIICPVVFFECKNYSDDIAGAEFAQLTSRFSDRRSKVGFIVCRSVDNVELIRKRCRDCFHARHEHVVVLTDTDLLAMLKLKAQNEIDAISSYLHAKFRPIFMDA